MGATTDFNYKVALASGLRSLQSGRLRQAEEHFRYLVAKFPGADGGHRGLAKVLAELEDRAEALATLRNGAALMAKAGQRAGAIALLNEAVGLAPLDLTTHRHLAAALSIAERQAEAVSEYVRFVDAQLNFGDVERARLEAHYALERIGDTPELRDLAERLDLGYVFPALPAEPALIAPPPEPIAQDNLAIAAEHLAEGRIAAAADLLFEQITSADSSREAQRLLIDVVRKLGRRDLAHAKCGLLAQALRLDGREDLAVEVDQLARTI